MTTTAPTSNAAATSPADPGSLRAEPRVGGVVLGAGALAMIIGAIVWATTDTDLWAALSDGTIQSYLLDAEDHRRALFANLVIWLVGAAALGAGGSLLAGRSAHPSDRLTSFMYPIGAALAVVSFTLWMGIIRVGTSLDPATAELVGFGVTRLDDLATIALIGLGPVCLAASTPTWMGPWLRRTAWIVAAATALALLAMFTDSSTSYGFALVPVGILWTIATAIAAVRAGAS